MTTTEGVVRRVMQMGPSRCPACGQRIEWHGEHTADGRYRVLAYCHDSAEQHFVPDVAIKARDGRVVDDLIAWVRGLFKTDALPDVRELMHYNRGALPS